MKCGFFLVATSIITQIIASPSTRRRRGYSDRSVDHSIIISDDPFIHPPWWHPPSPTEDIEPRPMMPNGPFGPYEAIEITNGGSDYNTSEEDQEITRQTGPIRTPGYGGPIWWRPPSSGSITTERNNGDISSPNGNNKREQIALCVQSCPVTTEYNPVCGSNNVTYANPGRLECEQRCGIAVELSKLSACSSSEQPSERPNEEYTNACMRSCPVTGEYNPVCGSNNVTYSNPGSLECAQNCGVAVTLIKHSSCGGSEPITSSENTLSIGGFAAICMRSCPVTSEYNPVCGSDNITYTNPGRLECAQNCGVAVTISRQTSCETPITEENKSNNNDAKTSTEPNLIPPTTNSITAPPYVNGNNNSTEKNKLNITGNNNLNNGNNGGDSTNLNNASLVTNPTKNDNNKENNLIVDNNSGNNSNSNLDGLDKDTSESKGRPGNGGNNNCLGIVNNRRPPSVKEVMACMQTCSLTSEPNPVCGTDSITYMNPSRLLCAQFCGVDVKVKKFAPCASTSITNIYCPTTCTNPPVTDNPVPVTPPIPSIEACMEACPASLEFKPVCGNNNVTYRNLEKLQCAIRCGIVVSLKRSTHCDAPEIEPVPKDNATLILECIEQCSVPQKYEPICGSNNITYNNTGHLICARQCGLDIEVKQLNPCPDVSATPTTSTTTEKVKPGQNGSNFTIDPNILANIWGTTSTTPNDSDEEFELDQRVQDKQ